MNSKSQSLVKVNGKNYLMPFILITSLFFLWGFAHGLLDVLDKHFQNILHLSKSQSSMVQATVYGGYFLAAIPSGLFMKKYGFQKGILLGLVFVAIGSLLFVPATKIQTFWAFLIPLFIIACGLAGLETAANPYTTVLGPKETAERRINLSQSFNAIGWIIGPLVGSVIILSTTKQSGDQFTSLAIPYLGLAAFVLLVGFFFLKIQLPEVSGHVEHGHIVEDVHSPLEAKPLFSNSHFVLAIVAQFFYVASQTGINSFFINYVTESIPSISDQKAGYILAFGGMGMFFLGRLSGSFVMGLFKPNKLLYSYSFVNIVLMALVILGFGWVSVVALFLSYFFMSIMFPTIFALGIKDLGANTKRAASFIVVSIVGGAICPVLMGNIADATNMRLSFIIPLIGFIVIAYYGLVGYKIKTKNLEIINI